MGLLREDVELLEQWFDTQRKQERLEAEKQLLDMLEASVAQYERDGVSYTLEQLRARYTVDGIQD